MFNVVKGREGHRIEVVKTDDYENWFSAQTEFVCNWLAHSGFTGTGHVLIPNAQGNLDRVLLVSDEPDSVWVLSELAINLPVANFYIEGDEQSQYRAALGWVLGQYQYSRYLETPQKQATLFVSDDAAHQRVVNEARGVYLTRDLINTPAGDMMPEHLSEAMQNLAAEHSAHFSEIVGDDLLAQNFPTIHLVGRASVHAPRLLDLTWGDPSHPKLTLVGKGVCFDSGGLDLKPASGMRLMKKDMGGAAHVLGLASLIMANKLPVRLRVLVPAVENAVSGNAFRPGDIVKTRKGLTVEIDNTDAEGRLVLCDALALADDEQPDLLIDFATLTGAARVALGLEVPGYYSTDDGVAQALQAGGDEAEDAIWRLPLHQGYAEFMKGTISDLVNGAAKPFGGSITAALYLQHFVEQSPWVHFDVGAWNDRPRPGRPVGGDAMGLRAVFTALQKRYS
ncbi:leucyl aminopeptidase family protein [Reinekea blandensis]|uniref:Putative aminopeptidase n=1 Tax=Reinekea blandensis MED297 TaxID=314283 RepID=A4BCB0_9GAMM|nr:leucyl aminopeptidase family protein [Reinekea blandensis]EAR10176.1 putative aminopeptidase [Reinekea sp. MED297] [Reinekea blandensis MED297]